MAQAEAGAAGKEMRNGPPSPFEDVKVGGEGWWGCDEQAHMQRVQEQERQRAAQLQHTRAWAEAQVAFHPCPTCKLAMSENNSLCSPIIVFSHTALRHQTI